MLHVISSCYEKYNHLFPEDKFIELDLGCGKGSFTVALAERYPDRHIVGADIMLGRLRKIRNRITNHYPHIENVDLLRATAVELIGFQLPRFSVDRIHILCPDPWPKARHRAKRLLCSEFFGRLANVIKPGGVLHVATDDKPYLAFILEAIKGNKYFDVDETGIDDIRDEGMKTDFERQWEKQGIMTTHLSYRRNDTP